MAQKSKQTVVTPVSLALGLGAIFIAVFGVMSSTGSFSGQSSAAGSKTKTKLPEFRKSDFTNPTAISNKYFSLPLKKTIIFEKKTSEGELEKIQIHIPGKTKMVNGVKTLVYEDSVWLDMNNDGKFHEKNELIEFTSDYLAQDNKGNVWYFGEDVVNYNYDENGTLIDTDTEGSWLAGEDILDVGTVAKPGIWMLGNPQRGDSVYQEYYEGEAEDETRVMAVNKTVKLQVPARINGQQVREFTGCIQTLDTTQMDAESVEDKYYCPQAGGLVKVHHVIKQEDLFLKSVSSASKGQDDDGDEDDRE